jgi:hypothetical protein
VSARLPALWLTLALSATAAGCAHTPVVIGVAFRVESNVPDATVWVDDQLLGRAADWTRDGRYIRGGFHRVELRHPAYYSVYQEIEPLDGGQAVIRAELHPLLE